MPVTVDNFATSFSIGTAAIGSLQFTLTAAANTVLLVLLGNNIGRSVSAVAYAGVALTRLGQKNNATELWGLTAPAAGANILSANWANSGTTTFLLAMAGVTYLNVATVNPFGNVSISSAVGATTVNISISAATGDLAVGALKYNNGSGNVIWNNGTQELSATASTSFKLGMADIAGAGGATTLSATAAAANWHLLGVALRFSATPATSPFTLAMMGCGV